MIIDKKFISVTVKSFTTKPKLATALILKLWCTLSYSRKNPNKAGKERKGEEGRIIKKKHVEIQGVNSKRSGTSSSN